MIVGLDFDRVLFKTDEFKEFLDRQIPGFLEHYPSEGNYDPEKHAESMGIDVQRIFDVLEHAEDYLYEDVSELEELREEHKLIVVSRGDPYFQERKIVDSGVVEHVDGYFIVEEESKDDINIDFLVDDRGKELEDVSVPGFLMKRNEHDISDIVGAVEKKSE